MRESIRGFADAVLEEADARGQTAAVAGELAAVRDLLADSADLRSILEDSGVPAHARRGVLVDLLSSRVTPDTMRLLLYCVEADRPGDLSEDVVWLATRSAAARDRLRLVGPAVLGHRAALERAEGYATAVLAPVRDEGGLAEVEDELFRFARIVEGSPPLLDALAGPARPLEERAAVVQALLEGRATDAGTRLATYAARIGRPRDFLDLIDAIVNRVALETRRRIAEVRAAAPLDDGQQQRLAAALGRLSGQTVEVRVVVDPAVLGGFVATMGDTVVDGSVRHRLDLLRDRLGHAEVTASNEGAG